MITHEGIDVYTGAEVESYADPGSPAKYRLLDGGAEVRRVVYGPDNTAGYVLGGVRTRIVAGRRVLVPLAEAAEMDADEAEATENAIPRARAAKQADLYARFDHQRELAHVLAPVDIGSDEQVAFFLHDLAMWQDLEQQVEDGLIDADDYPYPVEGYLVENGALVLREGSPVLADASLKNEGHLRGVVSLIRQMGSGIAQARIETLRQLRDATTVEEIEAL